jgi:hypothetical protein
MRWAAVLLSAALASAACGHKNRLIAPELVRPEPPTDLAAVATPAGVRLSWLRPEKYSGGGRMNDLGGFVIERTTVSEGGPSHFDKVGTLELQDQNRFRKDRRLEWVDTTAQRGMRYVYRVTAFTLDGYRSAPVGPVSLVFGAQADDDAR